MENELRLKRKQLGLTQAQMAKACGVSRRTYQTYEETDLKNKTYNDLLAQLNEIGDVEGKRYILSVKAHRNVSRVFPTKYRPLTSLILTV